MSSPVRTSQCVFLRHTHGAAHGIAKPCMKLRIPCGGGATSYTVSEAVRLPGGLL